MEKTRKKSSKQLLEEKQMKRYFRSKKRSQQRDHGCAYSQEPINTSQETESFTTAHIVKKSDVVGSVEKDTRIAQAVQVDIRTKKMKTIDDSSQTKVKTALTSVKRNVEKINDPENTDYSQNKLKTETDVCSETERASNFQSMNNDYHQFLAKQVVIENSEKSEKEMKTANSIVKGICLKTHGKKPKSNEDQNSGRNNCVNSSSTNIQEDKTNIACNHNDRSHVFDTTEKSKDKKIKTHLKYAQEEKEDLANEDEICAHFLVEGANIFDEKYKINNAEKEYHQHWKNKELGNKASKAVPPKVKIVYQIIEEIVETTEITYHIIRKDKLKISESESLNMKKGLIDIGSYVNRLETRAMTSEEGEKMKGGGGSAKESDECVYLTGKNSVTLGDSDSPLSDCLINNRETTFHTDKVERRKAALVY